MTGERRLGDMKPTRSGDFILVMVTLALVVFGVIMVFSASYYYSINKYGDPFYYLKRDVVWAVFGLVLMIALAIVPYKLYEKFAPGVMIFSVVSLALVFTPLGITRNHATRWIGVGDITFMPGEFAKIAAIVFVAWYFAKNPRRIRSFTEGILPMLGLCLVLGGLIVKQPNLSTALTVCGIIVGMMFIAGINIAYLIGAIIAGASAVAVLIITAPESEWAHRIMSFTDPFADTLGDGYQVIQGIIAMGSGGLWGVGLGKSVQKSLYLPEPQNDFILAIIGEELGYIGIIALMLVYIVLIWRGIHIAINAPDAFGTLVAGGITVMIALQVMMNIAVVTSSMPPTGVSLPFVSYGGNALLLFMGASGILLNISRYGAVKPGGQS